MFFFIIHHIFIAVVQHFNKVFVTFLTTQHQETNKNLPFAPILHTTVCIPNNKLSESYMIKTSFHQLRKYKK